ncbi:MAG TPA: hypothetical protein VMV44_12275 [Rectinemataceae bacterium]|nr:hypothetical protein [Rectinemataceae bacterium]
MRSPARAIAPLCACVLLLLLPGRPLEADDSGGIAFRISGSVQSYAKLAWPQSISDGGLGWPSAQFAGQSVALLTAESPRLLFRLRLAATAEADKASALDPNDHSNALALDVREAETALLPSSSLALRAGLLLRNFGLGSYGSPVNPFARDLDQGGFWGLDVEWTPSPVLSSLAIVSADRAARSGELKGLSDFDSGALVRFSPGIFDAAAGLYASGAGLGEVRPLAYFSVPLSFFLASLEAADSHPLSGASTQDSQSLRVELRTNFDVGDLSFQVGTAYRGIYPGRSASDISALAASLASTGLPVEPFSPFYGRDYLEFSLFAARGDAFDFSAAALLQLPWGSLSEDARLDIYLGDASFFIHEQAMVGASDGEFVALARAAGLPLFVLWTGVDFAF